MKFKTFFILFFLFSCSSGTLENRKSSFSPYTSKGFALVYNEIDYKNKIISIKLNESEMQVAHNKIKRGSIVVITNPANNKSVKVKVTKKAKYPDFFKALITNKISLHLELNKDLPFIEIQERVKNKSFVAEKAVTFFEEKKVLTKIPITEVKIDNISKQKNFLNKKNVKNYSILIGEFYSDKWAFNLIELLINEDIKKEVFKVKKLNKNKYQLIAGPYTAISTLKNDYFKLNKYGFDNLDIIQND